jgi:hypothetical protein
MAFLLSLPVSAAIEKELLKTLDLERALFSDQYLKLSAAGQDLVVILHENTNAIARGVAILVTESNTTLTSNQGLAPLAKQLNEFGWVTMLIPSPPTDFLTPREVVIDSTDSQLSPSLVKTPVLQITEQTLVQHLQSLSLIMQAVTEKAKEYPGFILVIAHGTSAASLIQLYAEQKIKSPDAMVVLEPYWPDRTQNNRIASFLANTSMPVLDIYCSCDNAWSFTNVDLRKVATIKGLKLQYRQRELIGVLNIEQAASYINKEIYGWLSHMGW